MRLMEYVFPTKSRNYELFLYPIGDIHMGASNCAEDKLKHLVAKIASKPNAYWFGGGDLLDAVVFNDSKRFDPSILPDWMLEHQGAEKIRKNLEDMLDAQFNRFCHVMEPIRGRCLGMLEGNHEYAIMKHHNRNIMSDLALHFSCPDLTDCAFVRFKFRRSNFHTDTVRGFLTHGHGGGRTSGAEPNILYRLAADKECEFVLKGHSHTFCIHPPIPVLSIPSNGEMPKDPVVYDKFAANWGSFLYTYKSGPSTYASRANYPVRPMYTAECRIRPHLYAGGEHDTPLVEINAVRL